MALDRWVWWSKKKDAPKLPSREDVWAICEDFTKGLADVRWDAQTARLYIDLHGEWSDPAARILYIIKGAHPGEDFKMRWIEVCLSDTSLNIITRMQDPVTEAIADGLAKYFALKWQAKLEIG